MARDIDQQILDYANIPTGAYPIELLHINVGTVDYNFEGELYSPNLYLTTCYRNVNYLGNEYIASGGLLNLSTIEETKDVKTNAIKITLGAVPNTIIGALNEVQAIGGRVTIHQAFFDENTGGIYVSPNNTIAAYEKWQGVINSHNVDENNTNGSVIIEIQAKNIVGTILSTKSGRFTSDSSIQQHTPGDRSAEFVASLVDFNPYFGREE